MFGLQVTAAEEELGMERQQAIRGGASNAETHLSDLRSQLEVALQQLADERACSAPFVLSQPAFMSLRLACQLLSPPHFDLCPHSMAAVMYILYHVG